MNIDNLTLDQIKVIKNLLGGEVVTNKSHPFKIGQNYLFRTVTFILAGRVTAVYDQEIMLDQAAWIADTGRFHDALKNGIETLQSAEIKPFINETGIGRGAIVDFTIYTHKLPQEQQ